MVNDSIRLMLAKVGKPKNYLTGVFGISENGIYNKFARESWTVKDLVKIADSVGARVNITFPDGFTIPVDEANPAGD